jgi:hypothetical protein
MKIHVPNLLFRRYINPEIDLGFKMYGEFHITKKTHGVITQELKFRNVITDIGLKKIASSDWLSFVHILQYCHLGTGATTPTSSDTALAAWANVRLYSSYGGPFGVENDRYCKMQWDYALGSVVGTWKELGTGWSDGSSNNLFCRMLFKDDAGNPISVTTTSDDTLTIVYYLHVVRSSDTPTENTITIDGTSTVMQSLITNTCLTSMMTSGVVYNVANSTGQYLGTGTGDLSPTQAETQTPIVALPSSFGVKAYVTGAFYREFYSEWPASVVGQITNGKINVGQHSTYNANLMPITFKFGTVLSKTDTTKKIRVDLRVTYGRAA